ncbi:MAG: hypothetical protein Q9218_006701 [Villophora microphyllina]
MQPRRSHSEIVQQLQDGLNDHKIQNDQQAIELTGLQALAQRNANATQIIRDVREIESDMSSLDLNSEQELEIERESAEDRMMRETEPPTDADPSPASSHDVQAEIQGLKNENQSCWTEVLDLTELVESDRKIWMTLHRRQHDLTKGLQGGVNNLNQDLSGLANELEILQSEQTHRDRQIRTLNGLLRNLEEKIEAEASSCRAIVRQVNNRVTELEDRVDQQKEELREHMRCQRDEAVAYRRGSIERLDSSVVALQNDLRQYESHIQERIVEGQALRSEQQAAQIALQRDLEQQKARNEETIRALFTGEVPSVISEAVRQNQQQNESQGRTFQGEISQMASHLGSAQEIIDRAFQGQTSTNLSQVIQKLASDVEVLKRTLARITSNEASSHNSNAQDQPVRAEGATSSGDATSSPQDGHDGSQDNRTSAEGSSSQRQVKPKVLGCFIALVTPEVEVEQDDEIWRHQ